MDLAVLNSQFRRGKLVENWNSLGWTERYNSAGDFELTSFHIAEVMSALPLGGPFDPPIFVGIDESDVPMMVESHVIEKTKTGVPYIKTSGRSFEAFLNERQTIRAVTSDAARIEWTVDATSPAAAAYAVAKAIVVDGQASALDIIPEMELFNSVGEVGVSQLYPVEPKELYDWMVETLTLGQSGIKSVMPTVNNKIAVIIYKGADKRQDVVFDVALQQLDQSKYLLSKVGHKNVMITSTTNGMEFSDTGVAPSGLSRRVGYQDISQEVTLVPGPDLTNLTKNKGKVALADRLPTTLFSGGVAQELSAGYKKSYSLGDIVKLSGEYGLSESARVVEFVRTQDQTGIKAHPTFEAVTL